MTYDVSPGTLNMNLDGNIKSGTFGYSKEVHTNDVSLGKFQGMNVESINQETINIKKEVHIDEISLGKNNLKMDSIVIDQNK